MSDTRGRARIGLLVPFTNSNLEPDMTLMAPRGVSIHSARLGGYDEDETPDAGQMRGLGDSDIDGPLDLLAGVRPDVILYGCTSATLTHGPDFDRTLAAASAARSGVPTVTAAGALLATLGDLGAARVGFASPYVPAINDLAVAYFARMGVEVVHRSEIARRLSNAEQGALAPGDVLSLGRAADHADAEAIVLSCTDMRSVEIIAELEAELGKPVVSSNQALMRAALRVIGITEGVPGFGRVLREVAA